PCAADVRRAGPHARAGARPRVALPGVDDPRQRRRAGRAGQLRRHRGGAPDAIARARAIVIGPSNPVVSIAPILAVPGLRDALRAARAPVVAVSPIVGGEVVKGPTEAFLEWA